MKENWQAPENCWKKSYLEWDKIGRLKGFMENVG